MPLRRGLRIPLALLAALLLGLAHGQPTYTIGLDRSASGVVPTDATTHVYLLDVPAGTAGFTVEVRGEDRDADLAVYFGDEELHYDISVDPNPTYSITAPRAGRYRIEVLNLLWQELPYTIRVRSGAVDVRRPTPPVAGPGSTDAGSIELGGTRTGIIPAAEMYREYALQVPAGTLGFTVRLTAGGADADMAVYYGREELYDDISVDPNPVFALATPRAGTYRIVVKNLLAEDLDYVLTVEAATAPGGPGSAPGSSSPSVPLACGDTAQGEALGRLSVGAQVTVRCPANCSPAAAVWGTDVYTDDSNVCAAAAHAGAIDVARGGTFVVTIGDGQEGYEASTRHGVASRSWGRWPRSFGITSAGAGAAPGGAATADAGDGLAGTWNLTANGHRGTLVFEHEGGALFGSFSLGRDERLDEVSFDGTTVRFVRPLGASTQEYVGRFTDDGTSQRLAGTFYQGSARTEYAWSAERPRPAGAPIGRDPCETDGTCRDP